MSEPHEIMRPYPLLPFPVGVLSSPGQQIASGDVYLAGWSFRETTGAAAALVELFDGSNTGGVMIATIGLAAGESIRDTVGGHLLVVRNGLFVSVPSGIVTGSLWFADRVGRPMRKTLHGA